MKVCIAAPIASADIAHLLQVPAAQLPAGYTGAPLTGILIEELLRLGHRIHALTVDYAMPLGAAPIRVLGEQLTFEILPGRRRAWRFEGGHMGRALDLFRNERQALARAITTAAPDVVHAHWSYEFALAALDSGVPHVVTAHDSPSQIVRYTRSPYRMARWLMARQALQRASCVTAVSSYMAAQVQGMARVPVRVVPNPVSPLAIAMGRLRTTPAAQRIGMVCNGWAALKNPEAALRAFALVRLQMPRAELHVFGIDFGPGERAQQWAEGSMGCKGIHFHGAVAHGALLELLNGMDLLLHASLEESFGVVLAEAMALGLPVVAGVSSGAVPEVAGPAQWLVDVHSPQAMSRATFDALSDHSQYMRASAAGRARVEELFTVEHVAEAYLNVYARALGQQEATVSLAISTGV